MSEVKRYDEESGCHHCAGNGDTMVEYPNGDWIEAVYYDELKEDLEQDLEEARQYAKEWMNRAREAKKAFERIEALWASALRQRRTELEDARRLAVEYRDLHHESRNNFHPLAIPHDLEKLPWENDDE